MDSGVWLSPEYHDEEAVLVLRITGLSKRFEVPGGHVRAVRDLDLTVEEGQFFVLLGPSGCGK